MVSEGRTVNEITATEGDEYIRLCETVDRGMSQFIEVGMALAELNEKRLYRAEFPTFEAFVSERFKLTRRRAYQMIEEARVAAETPGVRNGAQARALARIEPERRAEVLALADSSGKITAARIVEAARTLGGEPETIEAWRIVSVSDRIDECIKDLVSICERPIGRFLPLERIKVMAERLCQTISDGVPDTKCDACDGNGCDACYHIGYYPGRLKANNE